MTNSLCDELLQYQPSSSEAESLFPWYIAACIFNAFLSYTAIMLNSLTINAMRKTTSLTKSLKALLLSLAVSDLGVGLLVQPFAIALTVKWSQQNNPSCATYTAFTNILTLFSFASFFSVMVISVDRFLAIRLHLRYQELVTHKRVVAVVITKWVFSTFLSLMMLWTPTIVSYVVFAIVEVLCLVTTTLLNYKIYLAVLHHKNQIETIQVQQGQAQNNEMTNVARIRKSAISTFYVYLVFMACYLPQICSYVVITISGQSTTVKGLSVYTLTLVFLNSTLNPVIYCWKMRHIRHAIVDILRNIFSLHSETENHRSLR
ncbi:adenosine receptor A3-like [Oculina patagonica]